MSGSAKWQARRIKYLGSVNMGQSPDSATVTDLKEGMLAFLQGTADFGELHPLPRQACEEPPKRANAGDLLVSVRAPVGELNIADQDYGIGRGLCAITWRDLDASFGWWVTHYARGQLARLSTGSTYDAVTVDDVRNMLISYPSLSSQRRIADYLDRETAQIDALIEAKEQMLALLQEKRAAQISHMVTKGLDPNAEMKDSGLEWLGEVPAHWEVKRAKQLFDLREELSENGEEVLLTVSHITGVTPRAEKDVYMFKAEDMTGYKICKPNDLVINTLWAWMGAMGVAWQEGIVSPAYHVYTPKPAMYPDYVDLLCRAKPFVAEVIRFSKGVWSSRLRLYPESFLDMRLAVPPLEEQKEMVRRMAVFADQDRQFQKSLNDSISLLRERRSALITAAVTGQLAEVLE